MHSLGQRAIIDFTTDTKAYRDSVRINVTIASSSDGDSH